MGGVEMRVVVWCAMCLAVAAGAQTASAPGKDAGRATEGQAPPAQATVTFYSGGNLFKTSLPGSKAGTFTGCIFDEGAVTEQQIDEQQVVCLRWREYAVVKLAPGVHTFSASLSKKHGTDNSQTPILLEAGKNYYLRAENEHSKVPDAFNFHPNKGRLDIVSCDVARTETEESVPVGTRIGFKDWKRRPRDGAPDCGAGPLPVGAAAPKAP